MSSCLQDKTESSLIDNFTLLAWCLYGIDRHDFVILIINFSFEKYALPRVRIRTDLISELLT